MPRTLQTPADSVLHAVEARKGAVTLPELRSALDVPERTLQRWLRELVEQGRLHRLRRGVYSRDLETPALSDEAQRLLSVVRESEADAHLTGYDLLAGYAHQFVYEYPHLVNCHPPQVSGLRRDLIDAGFFVSPAGPRALLGPDVSRTVVLRQQPHAEGRYPIGDSVAAPEKAWVDLLREVRRSRLPFDYGELGRILGNMQAAGCDLQALRSYARRTGYLDWVRATLGVIPAATPEQRRLAVGYAS